MFSREFVLCLLEIMRTYARESENKIQLIPKWQPVYIYIYIYRKVRLMKRTHDSLLLRVSCLRTHQTVFLILQILSDVSISDI